MPLEWPSRVPRLLRKRMRFESDGKTNENHLSTEIFIRWDIIDIMGFMMIYDDLCKQEYLFQIVFEFDTRTFYGKTRQGMMMNSIIFRRKTDGT